MGKGVAQAFPQTIKYEWLLNNGKIFNLEYPEKYKL